MAAEEQKLSPEEKLLKVIQSDGKKDEKPSPGEKLLAKVKPAEPVKPAPAPAPAPKPQVAPKAQPAPAAASKPAVAPKPTPAPAARKEDKPSPDPKKAEAEKPKLKVLKSDEPAVHDKALIGTAPAVVQLLPRGKSKVGIKTINVALAAGIVIVLGLTGLQVAMGMKDVNRDDTIRPASAETAVVPGGEAAAVTTDIAAIVDAFSKTHLFPGVSEIKQGPQQPEGTPAPQVLADAAARLKLTGFTQRPGEQVRAILVDGKDGRMIIAQCGEKILVGDQSLELLQIHEDKVVLSDGKDSITVK